MNDNETRLRELLACHGSDVSQWPEEARQLWTRAQRSPRLAVLIAEEKRFEQVLRQRAHPMAARNLADRIIAASAGRPQYAEGTGWFSELLGEVRPTALAAMLILGFAVGFGILTHEHSLKNAEFVKTYSDDEGTIL